MRTALVTVMAAALLSNILGCSSSTESATPAQPVELVLFNGAGLSSSALAAIGEQFAKTHPNVKFTIKNEFELESPFPGQPWEGVDVVLMGIGSELSEYDMKTLKQLPDTKLPALNEVSPSVFDAVSRYQGKLYALPFTVTAPLVTVHETMLTQAGIQPPPLDWTWTDMAQTGAAAKAAGLPISLYTVEVFDSVVRSYGGRLFNANTHTWGWETPGVKQGLAMVAQLTQQGVLSTERLEEVGGAAQDEAALTILGMGVLVAPKGGIVTPAGVIYRPIPRGPQGRPSTVVGGAGCVPTTALHPELAAEYVRSLVLDPDTRLILARSGFRPVVADGKAVAAWTETVGQSLADAVNLSVPDLYVDTVDDHYASYNGDVILKGLEPYFKGKESLEAAIVAMAPKLHN
jgi:ABC-type glycerol-3-phosphate transport system substrate-binding protein